MCVACAELDQSGACVTLLIPIVLVVAPLELPPRFFGGLDLELVSDGNTTRDFSEQTPTTAATNKHTTKQQQ